MKTAWAIILVKFKDESGEPFPIQYYKDLFTTDNQGSPWNMVKYFDDYSHGNLDLTESKVFGWYQLDKTVDDYNGMGGGRNSLIGWARQAAMADGVDLSPFFSTVVCANAWSDVGAASMGVVAQGAFTVTPELMGQEMGHVYGLSHSKIDGSEEEYKDPWDIMSGAFITLSSVDPEFTEKGPGLNAWNMRSRNWLLEKRVWKGIDSAFDETIMIRTHVRRDLKGFLAAEIPGGYLAELRVKEGWDAGIPRPAVLIHSFNANSSYLMYSNMGVNDMVDGDSFGSAESDFPDPFHTFSRVDILEVNGPENYAKLRIRYRPGKRLNAVAIDPMALILHGRAYLIWVELHHPHVPKVSEVKALLKQLTSEERKEILARVKSVKELAGIFEKAAAGLKR